MASKHWKQLQGRIKPEDRRYARQSIDLVNELHCTLRKKGWTQKELARQLGKAESEISKWLSPAHNMTLKTIAKLETVLEVDLLLTPIRFEAKEQSKIFGSEKESQHYKAIISGHQQSTAAVSVSFSVPKVSATPIIGQVNEMGSTRTNVEGNDVTEPVESGTFASLITAA